MQNERRTGSRELEFLAQLAEPTGRRKFLTWSGVTIAVAAVGCRADRATQPAARTLPGAGTGLFGEALRRGLLGEADVDADGRHLGQDARPALEAQRRVVGDDLGDDRRHQNGS